MPLEPNLRQLYTLIGQALGEAPVTKTMPIHDYPTHLLGVLARCATDPDRSRAHKRMQALRAELERVAKQIEGIEDTGSEMIQVEIFETPDLTAMPRIQREVEPQAVETALGTSGIASPNGGLDEQVAFLMAQQKELSAALDTMKQQIHSQSSERADKQKPEVKNRPPADEQEAQKTRKQPSMDDSTSNPKTRDNEDATRKSAQKSDEPADRDPWSTDMANESFESDTKPYWGADPTE